MILTITATLTDSEGHVVLTESVQVTVNADQPETVDLHVTGHSITQKQGS
jgi:regulator of extracellular matrix RemA (YlzA/DUF370 family)